MSHSDPCPVCGRRLAGATIEASDGTVMCASHAADLLEAQSIAPPPTRGDCASLPRPCTRTKCRYNLFAREPGQWSTRTVGPACALDLVERNPGGLTLEEVGDLFGVVRERIRQLEARALRRLRHWCQVRGIRLEDLQNAVATVGPWDFTTPSEYDYMRQARLRSEQRKRERATEEKLAARGRVA